MIADKYTFAHNNCASSLSLVEEAISECQLVKEEKCGENYITSFMFDDDSIIRFHWSLRGFYKDESKAVKIYNLFLKNSLHLNKMLKEESYKIHLAKDLIHIIFDDKSILFINKETNAVCGKDTKGFSEDWLIPTVDQHGRIQELVKKFILIK